ncbi:MAG: HAD family phosphatase [Ruminococcaceae bacterium]|nr:HAD family phosphatase [Oscillospiraceae bacterium]
MEHSVYIFDFDGTLVDSMPHWAERMLDILRMNGVEYPDNVINIITPLGNVGTAEYFRKELGVTMSVEEILEIMAKIVFPDYRDVIGFKQGVEEYLRKMKAQGCSLNILTASPHRSVDACLKRLGMFDIFDNIWSTDDFGMPKSNPDIYRLAIKRIGCNIDDTVFFDDNYVALATASQAGMYTVGVYDSFSERSIEQIRKISNIYINTFDEIGRV